MNGDEDLEDRESRHRSASEAWAAACTHGCIHQAQHQSIVTRQRYDIRQQGGRYRRQRPSNLVQNKRPLRRIEMRVDQEATRRCGERGNGQELTARQAVGKDGGVDEYQPWAWGSKEVDRAGVAPKDRSNEEGHVEQLVDVAHRAQVRSVDLSEQNLTSDDYWDGCERFHDEGVLCFQAVTLVEIRVISFQVQ